MSAPGAGDERDAGVARRLRVVRTASGVWVGWPGGAKFFERERPGAAARGADGDGPSEIRAPMTARVVKLAVGAGSDVAADDLLVILQAMKMEYRLTAPRAGRVESIHCAEGEMVDLGSPLVTLAPPGAARS
ncbi:MAG TPA: acetyl-CoA carboxylase biotin carboxyl carrier protein subunit [Candidatus Polarisedimenticolia bacterium]|nr:acetyl-CoA carboxylase biotin carboxyl carrier protein subunit [Candidatus Polarisedimenticolia bacterium]